MIKIAKTTNKYVAPHFLKFNNLPGKEFEVNGVKVVANGQPYDMHRNRTVGVLLEEDDYFTELVLDGSGILMITKATEGKIISNTREWRSSMVPKEEAYPTRMHAKRYRPYVDLLFDAFDEIFKFHILLDTKVTDLAK